MKGHLKIIRVSTWLDFGGVEKRFANLSASRSSHEMIFIALGHGGWAEQVIKENERRVICLNGNPSIPNFSLIIELARIFRNEKPVVVHTSGAEANFHGLIAARIARIPVRIGEEIGFPQHGFIFRHLFKLAYWSAHAVVGISKSVVSRIVELKEVPARKTVVVYNPLSPIDEPVGFLPGDGVRLVTVCRLFSIKNLDNLIRLLPELRKKYLLSLQIVGDGPEMAALKTLAVNLELKDVVDFCGFKENPIPFLLNADMFILPSFSEGLSNSLLEAMAVGLPCIATQEGGPSELIEHGKTGWLIDPFDTDGMRRVIETVLALPRESRIAVGRAARNYVRQNFSLEHHESKLFQLYESFLNDQGEN